MVENSARPLCNAGLACLSFFNCLVDSFVEIVDNSSF